MLLNASGKPPCHKCGKDLNPDTCYGPLCPDCHLIRVDSTTITKKVPLEELCHPGGIKKYDINEALIVRLAVEMLLGLADKCSPKEMQMIMGNQWLLFERRWPNVCTTDRLMKYQNFWVEYFWCDMMRAVELRFKIHNDCVNPDKVDGETLRCAGLFQQPGVKPDDAILVMFLAMSLLPVLSRGCTEMRRGGKIVSLSECLQLGDNFLFCERDYKLRCIAYEGFLSSHFKWDFVTRSEKVDLKTTRTIDLSKPEGEEVVDGGERVKFAGSKRSWVGHK